MQYEQHVHRPLLPPIAEEHQNLRQRKHNFVLPLKDDENQYFFLRKQV